MKMNNVSIPSTGSRKQRLYTLLEHAWHWDLWISMAVCVGIGVVWFREDFEPAWTWIVPFIPVSAFFITTTTAIGHSVEKMTVDSDYGELVRAIDHDQERIAAPFSIARIVAWASLVLTIVTTACIEHLGRVAMSFIGIPTVLVFSWALFGTFSITMHQRAHNRYAASVRASMEKIARIERQAAREAGDELSEA